MFGILKSSEWGLIEPRGALTVGGEEITPFGFSAVPFFILAGFGCLAAFASWEERREAQGRDTLLDRKLLRIVPLRAGLSTLLMQQLILLGTFFVLPVYLQVVLGLDAFETGKKLFPLSVTMFLAALAGPKLAAGFAPRTVTRWGLLALAAASVLLLATIDVELDETDFVLARRAVRSGRRADAVPARQRDHVLGRPVQDQRGGRAPGHGPEPRRLARHGADRLHPDRRADDRVRRERAAEPGAAVVGQGAGRPGPAEGRPGRAGRRRRAGGRDARRPADQAQAVAADYGDAQLQGLKRAIGAVALFALLSLWFTRRLPGREDTPAAPT